MWIWIIIFLIILLIAYLLYNREHSLSAADELNLSFGDKYDKHAHNALKKAIKADVYLKQQLIRKPRNKQLLMQYLDNKSIIANIQNNKLHNAQAAHDEYTEMLNLIRNYGHEDNMVRLLNFTDEINNFNAQHQLPQVNTNELNLRFDVATPVEIVNDTQNVHDRYICAELKHKYEHLKQLNEQDCAFGHDINYTIDHLKNEIKNEYPSNQCINILLNRVDTNNTLSNFDDNEHNILANVWHRVKNNPHQKEIFHAMLIDCVDNKNDTVCLTGRCSRYMDTFVANDEDETLAQPVKTASILREEVFSKAAQIRTDVLANKDQIYVDMYNEGEDNAETQKITEEIKLQIDLLDYPQEILDEAKMGI